MVVIQQLINGVALGSVLALFALGFTLVFGIMDVVNMAQGALLTTGAFIGIWATRTLGFPMWIALIIAIILPGMINTLIELAFLKPLARRSREVTGGFGPMVVTLGISSIVTIILQQITHTQVYTYPKSGIEARSFHFGSLHITLLQLLSIVLAIAVSGVLGWYLNWHRGGIRLRAAAADRDAARLVGIRVGAITSTVFFVSGALAGVSGVLIGVSFNSVQYTMGDPYLLLAFVVITVGGLGSMRGSVVMGLVVGIISSIVGSYIDATWANIVIYALLFVILVVRPGGLFGVAPRTAGTDRV